MTPTGGPVTVAMITHNYLPAVGGAERQLNSLVPLFIERGITPVVYTRARPGLAPVETINGAKVIRVPVRGPGPIRSVMFVFGTLLRLIRRKPDVVHAYDTLTPSLVAGVYRIASGTPYLTKLLRSGELGDLNRLVGRPLGQARLELLRRSVTRFVAISRDLEAELAELGVEADQRVFIPNGVDAERFRPPAERELEAGTIATDQASRHHERQAVFPDWPDAPVVVVVGRVSPEKRVVDLARQWGRFATATENREGPPPWLYVVGEGPLSGELDGLDHVRFLGRREDVPDILRWADIYVSASSAEGLSNALLEAMSSGCACVVTDVGGVGDVMTDGVDGLIVDDEGPERPPERVVDDVLGRIAELLASPDQRLKLGTAARESVLRCYSLAATADALVDQYRSLASDRGGR